jgi:4-hydroxy-3-polyprenylbenzoate decarboxylase
MPYEALSDFLGAWQDTGEVVRITAPVDAGGELAAITQQVVSRAEDGGPILLFTQVRQSTAGIAVVTNLLGNRRRLTRLLGVEDWSALGRRWGSDSSTLNPIGRGLLPRAGRQAPAQQVIRLGRDVNLLQIPVPTHPGETNPVLHGALVITADPETGERFYADVPVQSLDRTRAAIHWPGDAVVHSRLESGSRQWPVAIVIGGDPLHRLAVAARRWPGLPEGFAWDGWLRGAALETVRCRSHDLDIPAHAEWILEGFLNPPGLGGEASVETVDPVVLPGGLLGRGGPMPVVSITAITHRATPLLPVAIHGPPPNEAYSIDQALERLFLPVLRQQIPELVDWHAPREGNGRSIVFAALTGAGTSVARRVLHALWGTAATADSKLVVLVPATVNVHDPAAVWAQVAQAVDFRRDAIIDDGPAAVDDSAARAGWIGRLGIDATGGPGRSGTPAELMAQIQSRWSEFQLPMRWGGSL